MRSTPSLNLGLESGRADRVCADPTAGVLLDPGLESMLCDASAAHFLGRAAHAHFHPPGREMMTTSATPGSRLNPASISA